MGHSTDTTTFLCKKIVKNFMTLQATHTKEMHDNRDMHLYLLNYFFFSLESHKPGLTP